MEMILYDRLTFWPITRVSAPKPLVARKSSIFARGRPSCLVPSIGPGDGVLGASLRASRKDQGPLSIAVHRIDSLQSPDLPFYGHNAVPAGDGGDELSRYLVRDA